jgi:hypothetical protein
VSITVVVGLGEGKKMSELECPYCGKTDFDLPDGCYRPNRLSPGVGDWICLNALDRNEETENASIKETETTRNKSPSE